MLDYVGEGNRIYRVVKDFLGKEQSWSYKIVDGIDLHKLNSKTLEVIFLNCHNREIY